MSGEVEIVEPDYKAMRTKLIEDNKLRVEARFIPQSQSRNAKEKHLSLNWKMALLKGDTYILSEQDYSQGIGHVPHYAQNPPKPYGWDYQQYLKLCAENGKCYGTIKRDPQTNKIIKYVYLKWDPSSWVPNKIPLPAPTIEEYLSCLIMDAYVLDAGSFKDWAQEMGWSDDSIKAKETYDACIQDALKLRFYLGNDTLEKLREAYSDY